MSMLQLQIRNLYNETFTIEIHENELVKTLKERIAEREDLKEKKYEAELLKLLCTGKVMDDDEMIKTYPIKPDKFLVLVRQTPGKPKPPPKRKPNQGFNKFMGFDSPFGMSHMSNPFMQQPFSQYPLMQQQFPNNTFNDQSMYTPKSNVPTTKESDDRLDATVESFSTAEERDKALQDLVGMGFPSAKSEVALRACSYNVDAALDYLASDDVRASDDNPISADKTDPKPTSSGTLIQEDHEPSPSINLSQANEDIPETIQGIRRMLQDNPEQLQAVKEVLQAEHPELAQMIGDNPQHFLNFLNAAGDNNEQTPTASGGGRGSDADGVAISLTSEEQAAVNRLQEMGFDKNRSIEAFLACDRNEELAVNYLLTAFD